MNELLVLIGFLLVFSTVAFGVRQIIHRRSSAPAAEPPTPPPAAETPSMGPLRADEVIERMSEGVVVLDSQLRPAFFNAAARRILGLRQAGLLDRLPSDEVLTLARRAQQDNAEAEEILSLWFPTRSSIKARVSPLGEEGVLVLLQDVTEETLAQQIRREFVAHASHELKSPVAGLQTLAEAVMRALEDDPAAASRFAERLATEAGRLGRLISDLLDLSRLEDPGRMAQETIELSDIALRELDQIEAAARGKEMDLLDLVERGVWVRGDEEQLGVMIRNLLENAVRYTPDGGKVALEVGHLDSSAFVRVRDTGMGIPREAQSRVFERFYRVDRARARDRGGTGLGLAIVKHVAELHGGQVDVESELGQGSTFTVTIPMEVS